MKNGFTLVEMAIVLIIIGLLLAGLMMPLGAQIEQRRIDETQKAMNEIVQALYGFAVINGRLPCPADPGTATGAAGAGQERPSTAAGCTGGNSGVIPWATLGVSETDAWNRRYTYRVTAAFADATDGTGCGTPKTGVSFELCSPGDNTVLAAAAGAPLIANAPAVVISHGANGLGAYTPTGIQIAGAGGEEQTNASGGSTFISHTPSATFDDLVTWLSPNTLMNRMVSAGKLP